MSAAAALIQFRRGWPGDSFPNRWISLKPQRCTHRTVTACLISSSAMKTLDTFRVWLFKPSHHKSYSDLVFVDDYSSNLTAVAKHWLQIPQSIDRARLRLRCAMRHFNAVDISGVYSRRHCRPPGYFSHKYSTATIHWTSSWVCCLTSLQPLAVDAGCWNQEDMLLSWAIFEMWGKLRCLIQSLSKGQQSSYGLIEQIL